MYQALGLTASQSLLVQGIYGAVGPIANLLCVSLNDLLLLPLTDLTSFIIFVLDSIGRKKPLMFGAASLVALFSVLSALVASFPPGENQNLAAQKAAIAMIFLMSIVFSLSFGPVSWVLAAEVSRTVF